MRKLGLLSVVMIVIAVGFSRASLGQARTPAATKTKSHSKADDLLKQMADYFGNLPAFSCRVESNFELKSQDHNNKSTTKMTVRLQRPNRLALIVDDGVMGMTVISDGKQLTHYLPMNKRYVVSDAPAGLTGLTDVDAELPITMLGTTDVVIPSSAAEFYRNLMDGVMKSDFLGQEKVGNAMCNHCRFIQDDFDWDIWIDAGKQPLVHKVSLDLSKQLADAGPRMKDAKISYVITFSDWNVAPKFTPADFTFVPPAGATKGDELIEEYEPPHPLLGQPAPPFTTTDVDGHPIDLKKYIGKNVILLDFWATWCGPCVEAMPQVDAVAKQYSGKGLVFFAVNSGEDAATVKDFLQSKKMDVPVAMDEKHEIGSAYAVEGIPQTVLIGKDGKVQVVHVGYSPKLPKLLSKEVEALLAGKDLSSETLSKAAEAHKSSSVEPKSDAKPFGATRAWSIAAGRLGVEPHPGPGVPRQWMGLATDVKNAVVYATGAGGGVATIDALGKAKEKGAISQGGEIRVGDLGAAPTPDLVIYQNWGPALFALNDAGQPLWNYPGGEGVDDVCVVDLNGDGRAEVVVGYNGGTGLHVLGPDGKLLWKCTAIGNVWHVAAGDFMNDGSPKVVTTSAVGKLHVFDAAGQKVKDIDVSIYAHMVRLAKIQGETLAIVCGTGNLRGVLVAVDHDGNKKWSIDLAQGEGGHADDLAIDTTEPWGALALRGGQIRVVDLESGQDIASIADQGTIPHVAWLPRKNSSPLLVVATGQELNAFEIEPVNAGSGAEPKKD